MIKVVSVDEMVAIDAATDVAGVSYDQMMENAGRGVADVIMDVLDGDFEERRVVVLTGPGNNGGDGLVAARLLVQETPLEVSCYLLKPRGEDDPLAVAAREAGVFLVDAPNDQRWRVLKNLVASADVVVDALLGTGARLPLEGDLKKLLTHVANAISEREASGEGCHLTAPAVPINWEEETLTVVAVDGPTGLDFDTGHLDVAALPADISVTFTAAKHGQLRFPGAAATGTLVVTDIGTPEKLPELKQAALELTDPAVIRDTLPARPDDGHKGTFGRAVAVAGSVNYTGAAYLAGLAAYRVGAGLVTMAVPRPIYPALSTLLPEATWLLLPHDMGVLNAAAAAVFFEEVGEADALLLGPGLSNESETAEFVEAFLQAKDEERRSGAGFGFVPEESPAETTVESDRPDHTLPPMIIDADGLNLLAGMEDWWTELPSDTILTPHPGEMARLTGLEREVIQADRVGISVEYAAKWKCVVILKGAFTVVAAPDGRTVIQPFASAALAKAGSGDVLSGAILGLLAQGTDPFEAAVAGAYLHGLAGQLALQNAPAHSPRSLIAGELADALSLALHQLS